jgi:nucleotide-binding universal stress UspA family protein
MGRSAGTMMEENAMGMYKRVLIPMDGSEVARAILSFVAEIATPLDLHVILLYVLQKPPHTAIEPFVASEAVVLAARTAASTYLAEQAADIMAKGIHVETRIRSGRPVDEILEAAREERVDMIAMTTHGRTGPGRLLFGSVAEGVLRQADVPVFLMRQPQNQERKLACA